MQPTQIKVLSNKMKHFVYLIMCLLILSIGSLFVLKSPKGEPWLSVSDFYDHNVFAQKFTNFKNSILDNTDSLLNDSKSLISDSLNSESQDAPIYKWQDEKGTWHYSDKPQENSEAWIKPENLTVIPAIKPLVAEELHPEKVNKSNQASGSKSTNPNKITELMNDVNNVQQLMDNRTKVIDEQLKKH